MWLTTPLEFGAKNWRIVLTFESDILEEIKVGTDDSENHPPCDLEKYLRVENDGEREGGSQ